MKQFTHYILLGLLAFCTVACEKDDKFTTSRDAVLTFSADTLQFDTVFTTIGSSTKRFTVYNENKENLRIANVAFASGGTSGFRLNLDGQYGTSFNNVELLGSDSLFCFVEVTINPQDKDKPVFINDQIMFTLESGMRQVVTLLAYGQDVIILRDHKVTADATFTAQRPYLIYRTLTIESGATLTIEPGASLYFHADGNIHCQGTIHADGTQGTITLRGDRLDRMFAYLPYDRLDNQWLGITLAESSHDNYFNNVDIHSGNYGIVAYDTSTAQTKLTLHNSVIHNMGGNGLQLTGCKVRISNTQISNCRGNCVDILGGDNSFEFCTIAQFCPWVSERGKALYFTNARTDVNNGNLQYVPLDALNITNSLIAGYASDEIVWSPVENYTNPVFNFRFTNCLAGTAISPGYEGCFINCVCQNTDAFRNLDTKNFIYDFRPTESSPARGIGTSADGILDRYPTDRLGVQRNPNFIDVGCYQFQ